MIPMLLFQLSSAAEIIPPPNLGSRNAHELAGAGTRDGVPVGGTFSRGGPITPGGGSRG